MHTHSVDEREREKAKEHRAVPEPIRSGTSGTEDDQPRDHEDQKAGDPIIEHRDCRDPLEHSEVAQEPEPQHDRDRARSKKDVDDVIEHGNRPGGVAVPRYELLNDLRRQVQQEHNEHRPALEAVVALVCPFCKSLSAELSREGVGPRLVVGGKVIFNTNRVPFGPSSWCAFYLFLLLFVDTLEVYL